MVRQFDEAKWRECIDRIMSWSGDPDEGGELLLTIADAGQLKGKLDSRLHALRSFADNRRRFVSVCLSIEPFGVDWDWTAQLLRLAATDPAFEWPWNASGGQGELRKLYSADVDETGKLSFRLAAVALELVPHAGSLDMLRLLLRLKPREVWIPAATLIVRTLASSRRSTLASLGFTDAGGTSGEDNVTSKRHRFVVNALTAAMRGVPIGGRDAIQWLESKDTNADDLSAIALASAELARIAPEANDALRGVAARAFEIAFERFGNDIGYQHTEAAQRAIERFGDVDAAWSIVLRATPTDRGVGPAAERLWDGHQSLIWLRSRGEIGREAQLLDGPLASASAIVEASEFHQGPDVARGDPATWLPKLHAALRRLHESTWDATPVQAQADALVTSLILTRAPVAATLEWRSATSTDEFAWLEAGEGSVGERGWVDLLALAARRGALFRYLLHRGPLDTELKVKYSDGCTRLATFGLSTLLRARWRTSTSRATGLRVDRHLTDQCASHIVRRLSTAGRDEAGRVIFAVLSADAPQLYTGRVDNGELNDSLWETVAKQFAPEFDPGELRSIIDEYREVVDKRTASAEGLNRESDAYRRILSSFERLKNVSSKTDVVWQLLLKMAQLAPFDGHANHVPPPSRVSEWISEHARDLAQALRAACKEVELALEENLPNNQQFDEYVQSVVEAADDEFVDVEVPVLDESVERRWRHAVAALRRLAEPLPWFIEAQLDQLLVRFEQWLDIAKINLTHRQLLLERIERAIRDEDEIQLQRVLDAARREKLNPASSTASHFDLLDSPKLRALSNFWLRRLRFDQNALLPKAHRGTVLNYYSPMVLAVLGAPLTTVQANYIWQPLIGDPFTGSTQTDVDAMGFGPGTRFAVVSLIFAFVCLHGIWQELKRRLAGLSRRDTLVRAIQPIGVLIGINYAASCLLWWVAGWRLNAAPTIFMWGTLSLYLGLFLGLFAQGNRVDNEDVTDH